MVRRLQSLATVQKIERLGVMNSTDCLRRQAELCLRLAQLCSDQPLLRHLNFLAARYHETALRTEFGVAQDVDEIASLGVV